jgi:hypothetical protein
MRVVHPEQTATLFSTVCADPRSARNVYIPGSTSLAQTSPGWFRALDVLVPSFNEAMKR